MLKFSPQVLTATKNSSARMISLDSDFIVVLEGKLCESVPLFEKGTSLSELKSKLGSTDEKNIQKLIDILKDLAFLESSELSSDVSHLQGDYDLGEIGSFKVEHVETQEVVYAIKMISEMKF